jgi:4-amino-4-deoxy-L-arabinose transferase-like glycosyltransferase
MSAGNDTIARLDAARSGLQSATHWLLLTLGLLVVGLWNLGGPQAWWDEGWTLAVARTWVESGEYARLREGQLIAPNLNAAPTVTVPVALMMRLFGVGLWQGRLFGVFCAVGVLLLLAALAARLFDRRLALPALLTALLLSAHPQIHPLLQGRQVLGEIPMLLCLLGGYLTLWHAVAGRLAALVPTVLLLGSAWITKGQTGPFLLISLLAPLAVAVVLRRWRHAAIFGIAGAGAYLVGQGLLRLFAAILSNPALPADPLSGVTEMVALVLTPNNRLFALNNLLTFGSPTLLALAWALWGLWRERNTLQGEEPACASWLMRLALVAFTGSWLAWFVALSVGVPRYMAPPVVVGSLLLAAMLHDVSGGFQIGVSMRRLADTLTLRRPSWAGAGALLALLILLVSGGLTLISFVRYYGPDERAGERVAALLNAQPAGSLVETYESELFLLLDQPYHYPPDQLHVELGRRSLRGETTTIDYDPLAVDPEFLVVGRFAADNELYRPVLEAGGFRLLLEDGVYTVYTRVR